MIRWLYIIIGNVCLCYLSRQISRADYDSVKRRTDRLFRVLSSNKGSVTIISFILLSTQPGN